MASGYTRQALANIQPLLNINAADLNVEFNTLANAFDSTSGHDHSGSVAGDGAKISLTTAITGILPTANGGTGSATITGSGLPVFQISPTIITPALTGPITLGTGGLTITTGGLTVSAGGITVTGNSTITGTGNVTSTLLVGGALTVSAGGITVTGNITITGTLITSGALTVSSGGMVVTAGGMNAIAGGVFDAGLRVFSPSNQFHNQVNTPTDPVGTANTTAVMCGLNQTFTPTISTRLLIAITGAFGNTTAGDGTSLDLRLGTGGAPANNAALTGTLLGKALFINNAPVGLLVPFTFSIISTGLTLNTTYWFDLSQKVLTGGTANISNIRITITEI